MRRRVRLIVVAIAWLAIVSTAVPASALEARVVQLRITGPRLWVGFEVRDLLRDNFLKLVNEGRAIFLQLQTDFWEDRRVFDRIVVPGTPMTWRIDHDPSGPGVTLQDQFGGVTRHPDIRQPVRLRVEIGPSSRVDDAATYYVNATLTAATVDERDIDQAGAALFGDEQSSQGLAGLGRFVFRTLLRMGKYFESATTETTSRRLSGREIRAGTL